MATGTGPIGTIICENIALNAAKKAHNTNSVVLFFFIKKAPYVVFIKKFSIKKAYCQLNI